MKSKTTLLGTIAIVIGVPLDVAALLLNVEITYAAGGIVFGILPSHISPLVFGCFLLGALFSVIGILDLISGIVKNRDVVPISLSVAP